MQKRPRKIYALLIVLVIGLGLASRMYASYLPVWIGAYAGDTLWALLVFLVIGFFVPRSSIYTVAIYALSFAFLIELSQLYHAPWIDSIRHTRLGGLVLGYGFLWSDLLCYSIGVAFGAGVERCVRSR